MTILPQDSTKSQETMKPTAAAWWKEFVEQRAWNRLTQETANLLAYCVSPDWSDEDDNTMVLRVDSNLTLTDAQRIRDLVTDKLFPYYPDYMWSVVKFKFDVWERPDPEAGKVFRGKTFIPPRLGHRILADTKFVNLTRNTSAGFLHYYEDGVFRRGGEARAVKMAENILGDDFRKNRGEEVAYWLAIKTLTEPEEANAHPDLVNVRNGMVNWRTGELGAHDPKYLSTIQVPVEYAPNARCPQVEEFLLTTLPGDCIEMALEFMGYLLLPMTKYQKALMLIGSGENGKSTYLDLVAAFLGRDNVTNIPLQELSEHRFKRAELLGKLANVFADLDAAALKSSSYFKMIVSGDPIDAERKHAHPFVFRPFARLIYSANKMPIAYDRSRAYFRRWLIVPFPNRFVGDEADPDIVAKMTTPDELSGLLNLAIEGLRRLADRKRFDEPETVKKAGDNYQQTADPLMAFLREKCVCRISGASVGKVELYNAYRDFCEDENVKYVESRRDLNTRLQQEFPEMKEARERYKGSDNPVRIWKGGPGLKGDYPKEAEQEEQEAEQQRMEI